MKILGLKPFGHDTNAAIVIDGKIIAATAEERLDRNKHSRSFPLNAIDFCLKEAKVKNINDLDEIAIGFNYIKFAYYQHFLALFKYFPSYNIDAFKDIIYQLKKVYKTRQILRKQYGYKGKITYYDHHDCHAALCYYTSGFENSAVLTIDGRGENASTRIYKVENGHFDKVYQMNYPDSLGGFYSAITEYLGFQQNSGEGKVMGLASYGNENELSKMRKVLETKGSKPYKVNLSYFLYHKNYRKSVSKKFISEFGNARTKDQQLKNIHENIAQAAQILLEEAMLNLAQKTKTLTSQRNLCMSGGVILNSGVCQIFCVSE